MTNPAGGHIPIENYYVSKSLTPGKWARNNPINNTRSFAAAASGIMFGYAVQIQSSDPGLVALASSSGLVLAGVAMESVDTHGADWSQTQVEAYGLGAAVGVGDQGPIIVSVGEAVQVGGAVRVCISPSAASGIAQGQFCTNAQSGKTLLISGPSAQWRSNSSSGINETGLMAELFLMAPFTFTAD